tara:strand:+ start:89 stop:3472 length:3384 start_codon:yes stop_codon:yes gene_type:complete
MVKKDIEKEIDYSYPEPSNKNIVEKIYGKREFHYHRVPKRKKMESYEEIKKYREKQCKAEYKPKEQQAILANLINPETPYTGMLVMHGTGTGKTCSAISIAEQFKDQVKKYNTKVFILIPGPNTRENFKDQLLFCTGDTYYKGKELSDQLNKLEKDRERKVGIYSALQNYKILSYKTFYKKVLGEKILEKKLSEDNKIVSSYRRNEEGDVERELVVDRINNMDNSILIVDEAHNLTNNEYGEALKKIIKISENLKVILLTATPMKNLADDVVDLLNFLRPSDDLIKRDRVFTGEKNYMMEFKPDGINYLKEMARGYVSFYRGSIPFTFAKRVDKGEIPDGLLFTPVIKCEMEKFQLESYNDTVKNFDDSLSKTSSAASNFVFPGLDSTKKKIIGYYSTDGLNKVLSQLVNEKDNLLKLINKQLFNGKLPKEELRNFMYESENKNINGTILNIKYLKLFSIKFYKTIRRLSKLVEGYKGTGTAFVYSNLVKAGGMEIFADALKENGYLEYEENPNDYEIKENTIDYKTGKPYEDFVKQGKIKEFKPATFLLVTGGTDDSGEDIPEIKQRIIREVFNRASNSDGKNIKFILGTKVMNEGITLENIKEIHILDVHYNLGKVDQVIGRGIRQCKHQAVINDNNRFPKVNVYRYVAAIKKGLSTDEILYQKAELKYLMVKKTERALKEVAIDCPLLLNNNKFPEEIEKYKGCVPPTLENVKKGKKICPALCDFEECDFKCDNDNLNKKYYKNGEYIDLGKKDLDYSTFGTKLANIEISNLKNNIKDLFRFKHIYNYSSIYSEIINSLSSHQKELFDEKFLYQALSELMPKSENDFNNFTDNIFDKYNRSGYLIKKGKFYIFQPFDQNENVPIYYRSQYDIDYKNQIPVENYVKQKFGELKEKQENQSTSDKKVKKEEGYNFDKIMDYYLERDEFKEIVGVIDKNLNKLASSEQDLFKIRDTRMKVLDKKRGTGIPTFTGAVCSTSKSKPLLLKILQKIPGVKEEDVNKFKKSTRESICDFIKDKLLFLEKYSTSAKKNKFTYIMIPSNHPTFEFPYNLEDRIKYILKELKTKIGRDIDYKTIVSSNGEFLGEVNLPSYTIEFLDNKYTQSLKKDLEKLGFKLEKNKWVKEIK